MTDPSPPIAGRIAAIRAQLARPCTEMCTGDFRPTGSREESWIGRVFLCREEEAGEVVDKNGKPLYPLAQFYLPALPFVPEGVRHVRWLTVFMGEEWPAVWDGQDANGDGWLIREYTTADTLIHYEFPAAPIHAFPLKPQFVAEDFPIWDGGGVPLALAEEITRLEAASGLEYGEDIGNTHCYGHKFGGYPSFCQSGICAEDLDMGNGFRFIFQISSDGKSGLNVVDNGSLMFSRHPQSGAWSLYFDFY